MRYLVSGEFIDPGAALPPEQSAELVETRIIPSLDRWLDLEQEGKILAGGILAGARAGVFILEATSNDEVNVILQSFPFWGVIRWDVRPLQTVSSRREQDRQLLDRLKGSGG